MVAVNEQDEIIPVYLKDVEDENGKIRTRLVNMNKESVRETFRENMYFLTSQDREAAKEWISRPEEYEYERILGL